MGFWRLYMWRVYHISSIAILGHVESFAPPPCIQCRSVTVTVKSPSPGQAAVTAFTMRFRPQLRKTWTWIQVPSQKPAASMMVDSDAGGPGSAAGKISSPVSRFLSLICPYIRKNKFTPFCPYFLTWFPYLSLYKDKIYSITTLNNLK